jgi:hypothetical protein
MRGLARRRICPYRVFGIKGEISDTKKIKRERKIIK